MPLEPLGDRPRGCGWLLVDPRAFAAMAWGFGGCWLVGIGVVWLFGGALALDRWRDEQAMRLLLTATGAVTCAALVGLHGAIALRDARVIARRRWLVEHRDRIGRALASLAHDPQAAALADALERGTDAERQALAPAVARLLDAHAIDLTDARWDDGPA